MNVTGYLKYMIILNLMLAGLFLDNTYVQAVEFSSTLNPVGSGARAVGMGGAFIGVADDATAASWNPAGLVQLEKPEVSAVYSYFHRQQKYSSPVHPEIATENTMDADGLNYASLVFPFALFKRNMTVSLNYQRLYDMNKDIRFDFHRQVMGFTLVEDYEFHQDGFLYAMSPAYALQITPRFSVGFTLNFWDNALGKNGWERTTEMVSTGPLLSWKVTERKDVSFTGINAHMGLLWQINSAWALGGVYKTAFDAGLKEKTFFKQDSNPSVTERNKKKLRMPPSYGLGLAFRPSDNWTAALDVYRTEWSRFVERDKAGDETNPLDDGPISDGRLKDTTQVRLGTEYLFIGRTYLVPVRAGLLYDPEPAKGHLDEFYGFSCGTGYASGRFVFDLAYQFRTGNNVTGDIPAVEGSNADIKNHTAMFSVIYYVYD
jgi:long-subunit fatty acid transport protein